MKTLNGKLITLLCALALLLAAVGSAQNISSTNATPLAQVLNPDGSLKGSASGSFDPKGYKMVMDQNGAPRFVSSATASTTEVNASESSATGVAGDEYWDGGFFIPGVSMVYGVFAITVNGTDVYVGGSFTDAGSLSASNIAKWDGSSWSALGSGVTGDRAPNYYSKVHAIGVSGTDVYVGGVFTNAGGVNASCIAKWNGSSWSVPGGGVSGSWYYEQPAEVFAIAVSGTDVYVGGSFTNAGGVSVSNIAKWNGSTWSALGSGVDDLVYAIAVSGSDVYVGGRFAFAGGVLARGIAKWNGSSWSALGSGVGYVAAVAVSGTDVYVGGTFNNAGGVSVNNIAKWNGSSWSALGSGIDDAVSAIAVNGTNVYASGSYWFDSDQHSHLRINKWDGSTWRGLDDGLTTASFLDASCHAIAVQGTNVYVGGSFNVAGEVSASGIAKWDGAAWRSVGSGNGVEDTVYAMAAGGTNVYVGNVGIWTGSSWSKKGFGSLVAGGAGDSGTECMAVNGTNVYVGGNFYDSGGAEISKWDGSNWTDFVSVNKRLWAIAANGTDVYVGGYFNSAGPISASNIAKWDGSSWSALGSGVDGTVYAIAVGGSDVYVGGVFTNAGGVSVSNIAKWDGSTWSTLGSGVNGTVRAIALGGTDVYVGGAFTAAGGVSANNIAKWNGSSWSALGSGVSSFGSSGIRAIAVNGTDVYAGGYFTVSGSLSNLNNIAKWNGSSWSGLGSGVDGNVYALAVNGTDVYVGGVILRAGGKPASNFAIWHAGAVGKLAITTSSPLPSGTVGTTYTQPLAVSGGTGTYTWSVVSNSLPSWLGLVPSTGTTSAITGMPTIVANVNFRVRVTDSTSPTNQVAEKDFTLTINPAVSTRIIGLSDSLNFGSVPVGTPTNGILAITNSGNSSLYVTNITYSSGVFSGAFTGSIAAGGATNVTVTFTPSAAVSYNATVTVYSDKTSGTNTIAATGTGIPVPTKIIGLTGNLAFGNVAINTTAQRTLTINNSGNTSLTVTNISYPPEFSGNWNSGSIAAGGSQNVTVSFTPTTTNSISGTIVVGSDASSGTNTISASGTGVVAPVITTPGLPLGRVGAAYSQSLTATGGVMRYTWSWAGSLPPGLTLSSTTSSNATVSGIPSTAGLFNFTVRVAGNNGVYSEKAFSLAINTLLTAPVAVTNAMAQVGELTIVPAGEGIAFTVGITNLGAAVSVQWDFGDGTTVTNANPTHTFANCGSYTVTAAVTDGISTNIDHSRVTVPCQLQLTKAQAKLNFAKGNGDSFSFTATLDPGTGFSAAGKAVTLDIGGAQLTYTLDGKGRYVGAQGTVKLAYSKSKNVWTLTAKLKAGNWQTAWQEHGLKNEDAAGAPVTLPVVVLIGDEAYAAERSLTYTAKKGKSGTAK